MTPRNFSPVNGKNVEKIQTIEVKADRFEKIPNNIFFQPTPLKTTNNMPKYDVHAKQHFLMPNSTLKSQMSAI